MPKLTMRGIVLEQPSLCTNAALVLLNVMSKLPYPPPRLIAVSSMGMGDNHKHMPLALRVGSHYRGCSGADRQRRSSTLGYLTTHTKTKKVSNTSSSALHRL